MSKEAVLKRYLVRGGLVELPEQRIEYGVKTFLNFKADAPIQDNFLGMGVSKVDDTTVRADPDGTGTIVQGYKRNDDNFYSNAPL